jgi:putative flippase GtrA
MTQVSPSDSARSGRENARGGRALRFKAAAFALIGLGNTGVDYGVFLLARALLDRSAAALAMFGVFATSCRCGSADALLLIAANIMSWAVAVTSSYILNSSITFAAESGRRLGWRAYGAFVAAGVAGLITNTATLVFAAQILALPVWLAKAAAVLAGFVVNFSLSHFIVFRVRGVPPNAPGTAG